MPKKVCAERMFGCWGGFFSGFFFFSFEQHSSDASEWSGEERCASDVVRRENGGKGHNIFERILRDERGDGGRRIDWSGRGRIEKKNLEKKEKREKQNNN